MATTAKEILQRFKAAQRVRKHKDELWHELDLFDRGDQWEAAGNIPPWIPRPVTNFVHLVKTTKRAALAVENQTGRLRAVNPHTIDEVRMLDRVYRHEWKRAKCRKASRDAIAKAILKGTGIVQFYWDEDTGVMGGRGGRYEGEIKVRSIDPAIFYPDPSAFRLEDCAWIHIVERKHKSWLKRHPLLGSKFKEKEMQSAVSPEDMGEIYDRDYQASDETRKNIVDFHTHYERNRNEEGGFVYSVTYMAGNQILHRIDKIEPNCYPFAILYDWEQDQEFWAKSTCQIILDNQKLINKVESIIAFIGTLMQNPARLVSRQSGLNPDIVSKYGFSPGWVGVVNGDPAQAVHLLRVPDIPQQLFNLAEQAKQNIREITGLTEAYMGQNVGSLQTSSGVNSLIERSTMRDRDKMFDIANFIEDMSRLLIKFIVTKHVEERWIRYEEDGQEAFFEYLGSNYADLDYEFVIDVSAEAPISRARQSEELDKLLTLQGQYGFNPPVITPQEYMKHSDFINGDELIDRMNRDEQQLQRQMTEQIVNLIYQAMTSGQFSQEEVVLLASEAFEQLQEQQKTGIGSANTSQIHMQQQGV